MRSLAIAFVVGCLGIIAGTSESAAQNWRWWDDAFSPRPWRDDGYRRQWRDDWRDEGRRPAPKPQVQGGDIRDGGAKPEIRPVAPPVADFTYDYPANSIVIDAGARRLYYVLPGNRAYVYTISVGREGFDWTGVETVSAKRAWPDWNPPAEMRQRDPSLPLRMTGGLKNPLGAMALYLGTTLYRIHGTNDERTLGGAQSSGCFRMLNANVLHLASLTEIGTTVHVVPSLAPPQQVSRAERAPDAEPSRRPQQRSRPPEAFERDGFDRWQRSPGYWEWREYSGDRGYDRRWR